MRWWGVPLLLGWGLSAFGQHDLGVSVGGAVTHMSAKKSEGHSYSSFSNVHPSFSLAASYRRCRPKPVNLGFEIQFSRREFGVRASDGSLAGSSGVDVTVELNTLYANVIWEYSPDSSGLVDLRFGFLMGAVVGGRMTGRVWNEYPYNWSSHDYVDAYPSPFRGDLRGYLGLGFKFPFLDVHRMTMDPYFSFSITSMLSEGQGARCTETGVRVGWAIHRKVRVPGSPN